MKTAIFLLPALLVAGGASSPDLESRALRATEFHKHRDYQSAADEYEKLLVDLESTGHSPELAGKVHNGLATIYQDLGRFAESERAYRQALALYVRSSGDKSPFAIGVLANLGSLYLETRQLGRLRETARDAADILESISSESHESARLEHLIGLAEKMEGRMASATFHLSRARTILQSLPKPDATALADILNSLGTIAFASGQYGEAVNLFQEAMLQYDKAIGVTSTNRAATLANIACAYLHLRRRDDAQVAYSEAVNALGQGVGLTHPYAVQVMQAYAIALEDTGDKRGAQEQRRRADAVLRTMEDSNPGRHVVDVIELQGGH